MTSAAWLLELAPVPRTAPLRSVGAGPPPAAASQTCPPSSTRSGTIFYKYLDVLRCIRPTCPTYGLKKKTPSIAAPVRLKEMLRQPTKTSGTNSLKALMYRYKTRPTHLLRRTGRSVSTMLVPPRPQTTAIHKELTDV